MAEMQWLKNIGQSANRNSPTILSGAAVAGVIATAILAVRSTPKAYEALSEEEDAKGTNLTLAEKAKTAWRFYIPAALSGTATIACIIGANQIGARRYAALAGAYTLVDKSFREYKDEVLKQIGEKKEEKIQEAIAERHIRENPPEGAQVVITGKGEVTCWDEITGRYFKSDVESIRRAENDLNRHIIQNVYADHNMFYELLGLEGVVIGEELGWNIDHPMELRFSSHLSECGLPCLAVHYVSLPIKDYGKVF